MRVRSFLSFVLLLYPLDLLSQPVAVGDSVRFFYPPGDRSSVTLVGDFNSWSREESPLVRDSAGLWSTTRAILPGIYQYKFVVDGLYYVLDPGNPATIQNFDGTSLNNVFVLTPARTILLENEMSGQAKNLSDTYDSDPSRKGVYLNIIWHQHQPLYVNPATDQLQGPWVRTHSTKDYYDMAAILRDFPRVHCTINLTSSLLLQLKRYYVDRLGPFIDTRKSTIDVEGFRMKWQGRTDPWIDLALKRSEEFDKTDRGFLHDHAWNAFGISEVMIDRFPEYKRLKQKLDVDRMPGFPILSVQEMREAKFWFFLAHFDPDFLLGPVLLPDGSSCDLSDLVEKRPDAKYYLRKAVEEEDCRRMVVEAYKVMTNVIAIHNELMFDAEKKEGQVEVITTPYYHPILPLIYDTELARICQPDDQLPERFSFPTDANAQVVKAVVFFREIFGKSPFGMWPGEGAVADPVLTAFRSEGILWTASDIKILKRSHPAGQPNTTPYRFSSIAGDESGHMALVFRDTELSDRIGFTYQTMDPEQAAEDFVQAIISRQPGRSDEDVLVTVVLDGENAWEWYRKDEDGKGFLKALYRKLTRLFELGMVTTVTPTEYITGNSHRGVSPHPIESLPAMEWLYPGSWINGNFDTWIGEEEENQAWAYLLRTRRDLEGSGLARPDPTMGMPEPDESGWAAFMAWESLYAAEGSDWFWWYGKDQTAPAGDSPFDEAFRLHLTNVYRFMQKAGVETEIPVFLPLAKAEVESGQGVMAMGGSSEKRTVLFTCNLMGQHVESKIFIVGNLDHLGSWIPNKVPMFDDGTHGDLKAGDGIWSLEVEVPEREEILYKYTNSGIEGSWGGEEFPGRNRRLAVRGREDRFVTRDSFGRISGE